MMPLVSTELLSGMEWYFYKYEEIKASVALKEVKKMMYNNIKKDFVCDKVVN